MPAEEVGIEENDGFEHDTGLRRLRRPHCWDGGIGTQVDIRFGEKFEFFADEFYALAVGTVHEHDIGFDFFLFALVDFQDEIVDDGSLAGTGGTVKNDVGNTVGLVEIIEFFDDVLVNII